MPDFNTTSPKHDPSQHMVHKILPLREVHILAGPSGGGKTTWLLKMIQEWARGEPVFGYKSFPLPYVYVSCDRSGSDCLRTFARVGINPDTFPYLSALEAKLDSVETIIKYVHNKDATVRVFFIEAFTSLAPGGKNSEYDAVKKFLTKTTRLCQDKDVTILGMGHSPKAKEGEKYSSPRERILGSVAWGGFSNTTLVIEPSGSDDGERRVLYVLPRNAKDLQFKLAWKDGQLVDDPDMAVAGKLDKFLEELEDGREFEMKHLVAKGLGSRSAAYRWLETKLEEETVSKVGRGVFCKVNVNPNDMDSPSSTTTQATSEGQTA